MNRMLVAAVAVIAVAFSGVAMAETVRSRIRSVDAENNLLTLKNGLRLHYGDDVPEADLIVGKAVKVTYKKVNGPLEATKIEIKGKETD